MLRILKSKRTAIATAAVTLIAAGGAVAYFTGATGSGDGSGTVGTSAQWAVSVTGTPTFNPNALSAIYPGNGTEVIPFTVTNNGNGTQNLASVTYAVKSDTSGTSTTNSNYGDAMKADGTDIAGCLASWFTVVGDSGNATPGAIAHGGTYSGSVDLSMPNNTSTDQSACKSAAPVVTVTAAS